MCLKSLKTYKQTNTPDLLKKPLYKPIKTV